MWILCTMCIEINCHIKRIRKQTERIYGEINRLCNAPPSAGVLWHLRTQWARKIKLYSSGLTFFLNFISINARVKKIPTLPHTNDQAWKFVCVCVAEEKLIVNIDCDYTPLLFTIFSLISTRRTHKLDQMLHCEQWNILVNPPSELNIGYYNDLQFSIRYAYRSFYKYCKRLILLPF